jgi:ABC-2 type transport system ATP-binding protein
MPAKVIVRDLRKRYADVAAVAGVSFTIEPGEIFGLLGPNGAGKTTTLECLTGLREPDAGELEICGLDARRQLAAVKQRIGVALQSTALPDKITPREALRLFGSFYAQRSTPEELIARFALTEKADARFDTLSGGQRQRLALALAFVNRPELVFLDEPTTGLDPQSRRELHAAIAQMKQDGYTVLFTTHYLDEAETLCDRVAIIDRGRIVATGTPRELVAQTSGRQSVSLVVARALEPAAFTQLPGISALSGDDDGRAWRFQTTSATETLAALARLLESSRNELLELEVRKASLEDVFLRLTQESSGAGFSPPSNTTQGKEAG